MSNDISGKVKNIYKCFGKIQEEVASITDLGLKNIQQIKSVDEGLSAIECIE